MVAMVLMVAMVIMVVMVNDHWSSLSSWSPSLSETKLELEVSAGQLNKMQQGHQGWRYHRRHLDYQSPYFQLKFPLDIYIFPRIPRDHRIPVDRLSPHYYLKLRFDHQRLGGRQVLCAIKDTISIWKCFWIRSNSKKTPRISSNWHATPTKPGRLATPTRLELVLASWIIGG